jgi:hypothetical protein
MASTELLPRRAAMLATLVVLTRTLEACVGMGVNTPTPVATADTPTLPTSGTPLAATVGARATATVIPPTKLASPVATTSGAPPVATFVPPTKPASPVATGTGTPGDAAAAGAGDGLSIIPISPVEVKLPRTTTHITKVEWRARWCSPNEPGKCDDAEPGGELVVIHLSKVPIMEVTMLAFYGGPDIYIEDEDNHATYRCRSITNIGGENAAMVFPVPLKRPRLLFFAVGKPVSILRPTQSQ